MSSKSEQAERTSVSGTVGILSSQATLETPVNDKSSLYLSGRGTYVNLLLGLTVAVRMQAESFLVPQTLMILALGLVAFMFDTFGGVIFGKIINIFAKKKINPMIGAAGISAFPMSSRVIAKMAKEEDPYNFILMQAAGANVAGQVASVIAGGLILALVGPLV